MNPNTQMQQLLILEETLELENQRFKKRCEDSLAFFFVHIVWPVLKPKEELQWGWVLALLCRNAECVMQGIPSRWVVNVSVRTGKSLLLSVALPIWVWLKRPGYIWAFYSHSPELREDFQKKRLKVLRSDRFTQLWGTIARLPSRSNIENVMNDAGGELRLLGASATGLGGDGLIIDDPSSITQARSDTKLQAQEDVVREAIFSRLNKRTGPIILVQQRASTDDLSGKLSGAEGWKFTALPAYFEQADDIEVFDGTKLRVPKGSYIDPVRYSQSALDEMRRNMGSRAFDAQVMQRPHAGDLIVNGEWLKPIDLHQGDWRPILDYVAISVDTASVAKEGHSRWGIGCWGSMIVKRVRLVEGVKKVEYKNVYILLDCATRHMEYAQAKKTIIFLAKKYQVNGIWIESATHGIILAQDLQRAGLSGVKTIAITGSDGDKPNRLWSATSVMEDGRVYIPQDEWAQEFKKDLIKCKKKLPRTDPAWDNADQTSLYLNEAEFSTSGFNFIAQLKGWAQLASVTGDTEDLEEPWPLGYDPICPKGYVHRWDLKRVAQVVTNIHSKEVIFEMTDLAGNLYDVSEDELEKLLEEGWKLNDTTQRYAAEATAA
jgi:hypothetical protein